MASRHLLVLAMAALLAPLAAAAPAAELSGSIGPLAAQSPVTLRDFLQRARQPAAATRAAAPGGQVARSANDSSAYRFDMTQNGRRMTAEEFDAWMKARGIRVATGKPAGSQPAAAAAATTASSAAAAACQPTQTTQC